jgi:uncharacterized membrane protein (DUF4010 family)
MGARARRDPALLPAAVAGAAASTVATFVELAILIGTASPDLLRATAVPLAAGGLAAVIYATIMAVRARNAPAPEAAATDRPFRWKPILGFVAIVGVVTLISVVLHDHLGGSGAMVGSIAGALADVHASASALAAMHQSRAIDTGAASLALLAAISTNSGTKLVFAISSGSRRYWLEVGAGVLIALAAAWAGYLVTA